MADRYGLASVEGASGWLGVMSDAQIDRFRQDLGNTRHVFLDTGSHI